MWPEGVTFWMKLRARFGLWEPTKQDPVKGILTLRYCRLDNLGFWDPEHYTFTLHCPGPKCKAAKQKEDIWIKL